MNQLKNSKKIFGTDGIRGLANQYPMTSEIALKLGKAIALLFKEKESKKIVIGKDTRKSNYMLEQAISAGICSMGVNTIFLGPIPTPGIAFITRSMRADAGVVISASHNPYYDNGIKLFNHDGYKLPDAMQDRISEMLLGDDFPQGPTDDRIGKAERIEDAQGRYITYLKSTLSESSNLEGMNIALDCAHGAGYKTAPILFEELGAQVSAIGIEPNGSNINENSGALYLENLTSLVRKKNVDVGIALDGDADRLMMIDETGSVVDGDQILALCALNLKKQGKLNENTFVSTIMSNMGVELYLREQEVSMLRTQVGDRYVIQAMRERGLNLGGEQSGHIILHDFSTTGDGLLSALRVLEIMREEEKSLHDLVKDIPLMPQKMAKVLIKERIDWKSNSKITRVLQEIEMEMQGRGRSLLRYSGTELVFRIMLEAEDESRLQLWMERLVSVCEQELV